MKVMIYGTSPLVGSGYASAVRYVSRGLVARGHTVANFAWNSHAGQPFTWLDGIKIYPRSNLITGSDGLAPFCEHFKADIILAICDPWVMSAAQWRHGHKLPVVMWYPCQSEPASRVLVELTNTADQAWCYSQWGTHAMREAGATGARYVPLGVDTSIFKPMDKQACRATVAKLGIDISDRTLAVMVAANSSTIPTSRKAFDQVLQAFALYVKDDPDALLYMHTWPSGHQGGTDLAPLISALGLEENVFFPDAAWYMMGLPDAWLAELYNAADMAIQTTAAEGFGLPILEAQACGCPVLTTHYSSMPELTRYGLTVWHAARLWAPSPMDGWVHLPDPDAICDGIRTIREGRLNSSPQDGLDLARELSWDRVLDWYVCPALLALENTRAALAAGESTDGTADQGQVLQAAG
jgi:glycosyltransferase involved in cell wall biosynthesis